MDRFQLSLSLFILPALAVGQHGDFLPCATHGDHPEWHLAFQQAPKDFARNNEVIYLPVTVHSVGRDDGTGHLPVSRIYESFCRLNADFEPYGIQFFLKDEIQKINRTLYFSHSSFSDGARMMSTFRKPLTINTFITDSAPSNACGYWHQSTDGLVVIKNCMGPNATTWTHEVGHFLSLPHTFRGWEGVTYKADSIPASFHRIVGRDTLFVETADGSNCHKAGDRFCDTPADYLSFAWNCNNKRESFLVQRDPVGKDFRSNGTNYMSYSTDNCQGDFSAEQAQAMRNFIAFAKSAMVSRAIPIGPVSLDPMVASSPLDGESVRHQGIELQWEHQINATQYLVQISRFVHFAVVDHEFLVSGTNKFNIGDLPERTWHWRIKPLNPYDGCAGTTYMGSFRTVAITNTDEISGNNALTVFPTLLTGQSSAVHIMFDFSELISADVEVLSLSGAILKRWQLHNPGRDQYSFELGDLPSSLYLLRVRTARGQVVRKISKQ